MYERLVRPTAYLSNAAAPRGNQHPVVPQNVDHQTIVFMFHLQVDIKFILFWEAQQYGLCIVDGSVRIVDANVRVWLHSAKKSHVL